MRCTHKKFSPGRWQASRLPARFFSCAIGLVPMSTRLESLMSSLLELSVPEAWRELSYPRSASSPR